MSPPNGIHTLVHVCTLIERVVLKDLKLKRSKWIHNDFDLDIDGKSVQFFPLTRLIVVGSFIEIYPLRTYRVHKF